MSMLSASAQEYLRGLLSVDEGANAPAGAAEELWALLDEAAAGETLNAREGAQDPLAGLLQRLGCATRIESTGGNCWQVTAMHHRYPDEHLGITDSDSDLPMVWGVEEGAPSPVFRHGLCVIRYRDGEQVGDPLLWMNEDEVAAGGLYGGLSHVGSVVRSWIEG